MAFRHYVRVKMDKVPTPKENSVLSLVNLPFVTTTVTLPHFGAPENQDLDLVKTLRKPIQKLDLSPFPVPHLTSAQFS